MICGRSCLEPSRTSKGVGKFLYVREEPQVVLLIAAFPDIWNLRPRRERDQLKKEQAGPNKRESVGRASVAIRKPLEWYDRNADNPPWIKALAEVRRLAPIAQMFRPQRGSSSQLAKQSEQIFRNGERKSSPVTCFARPSPAVNERRVADSQRSFRTRFQRTLFKRSRAIAKGDGLCSS